MAGLELVDAERLMWYTPPDAKDCTYSLQCSSLFGVAFEDSKYEAGSKRTNYNGDRG